MHPEGVNIFVIAAEELQLERFVSLAGGRNRVPRPLRPRGQVWAERQKYHHPQCANEWRTVPDSGTMPALRYTTPTDESLFSDE
jgi:hypothetical protein